MQWIYMFMLNTSRPRQIGRHFPDDFSKCIFLNENVWISNKISMKFVPKGPINNIPALPNRRQAIIWTKDNPVRGRIYMRHSVSTS